MPIKQYADRPDKIWKMYRPENPMYIARYMSRGMYVITVSGVNRYGEKSHSLISEENENSGKNVTEESKKCVLQS